MFRSKKPQAPEPVSVEVPKKGVRVAEVFTPSVPAGRGFVGREVEMKDLRTKGLRVPGTQIVVWGESGAGKSSLINKALLDEGLTAVKTSCTPDSTYSEILASAFAGTGAFYVAESTEGTEGSVALASTFGSELIGAKVEVTGTASVASGVTRQPITAPQLSPQRLVAELGARDLSWVIEDFHKVAETERTKLAHALKVFADEGARYESTRVIVLGVSESVDELVAGATNVGSRLVDIQVPPLGHDELGKILDVGGRLLNLDFSTIRSELLDTAVGTASITHALALACCDEREVTRTVDETTVFSKKDFVAAAQGYVRTRSGTVRARFRSALKVHRKRTYDNTEIILRALTQLPESGGTVGEILAIIRREHKDYPSSNATHYLRELQEERRGALIRKTASGEFRFDEPLQHAYAKSYFGLASSSHPAKEQLATSAWQDALDALVVNWASIAADLAADHDSLVDAEDEPTD